jgi:shikimate 5-dehydrogenase
MPRSISVRGGAKVSDPAPSRQRLAVVAGAGGELGRAITRKLVDTGVSVVAVDRNEERLAGIAEVVVFLASEAASPISGAVLPAYGPRSMWSSR